MNNATAGRGKFILIEGLDRCGKDTQINILLQKYKPAIRLAFPNETLESGHRLRMYLRREIQLTDREVHELFAQNRRESMDFIVKNLNSGVNIFCSRYAFSGAVYTAQKGYDLLRCCVADRGIAVPDLTILLYGDVSNFMQRADGGERYETLEIQQRVRQLYLDLRDAPDIGTWASINVDGKSVEQVAGEIEHELVCVMHSDPGPLKFGLFAGLGDLASI